MRLTRNPCARVAPIAGTDSQLSGARQSYEIARPVPKRAYGEAAALSRGLPGAGLALLVALAMLAGWLLWVVALRPALEWVNHGVSIAARTNAVLCNPREGVGP